MPARPTTPPGARRHASPARFLLPFAAAGAIVALASLGWRSTAPPAVSRSQVLRDITEAALLGTWLGPLRVDAEDVDPATGDLLGFHATGDGMIFTARRARLQLDADEDTVTFHLDRVTIAIVPPPPAETETENENAPSRAAGDPGIVTVLPSHALGPLPYRADIVPDAHALR